MSERGWETGRGPWESFRYPAIQPAGFRPPDLGAMGAVEGHKARDRALQQEVGSAVEAARKQGLQEGQAQANMAAAQALEQERSAVIAAVREFGQQRREYFRRVEIETARLALAIARKVLNREAQMDPLLLAGVVRVALDQMQAGTRLVLRTSPGSAPGWAKFCVQQMAGEHGMNLEVVPDSSLESHRCILEAEMGSTEISLDAQLHEIESGFFDLLREKSENAP
ncbi:MAG: FliH/SctL family protein [Candidatus Korobacteraceae bacterium]